MIQSLHLTAIILAGGKSRRMKEDKRLIELGGIRLINHTISIAEQVSGRIIISSNNYLKEFSNYEVVPDIQYESGPLTGLVSALGQVTSPSVLLLSCDMPFISVSLINVLLNESTSGSYTAFRLNHQIQPFPAIISTSLSREINHLYNDGNRSYNQLLKSIPTRIIEFEELSLDYEDFLPHDIAQRNMDKANFKLSELCFLNINTPEDLAMAKAYLD